MKKLRWVYIFLGNFSADSSNGAKVISKTKKRSFYGTADLTIAKHWQPPLYNIGCLGFGDGNGFSRVKEDIKVLCRVF